ncbi:MAG: hypothetical protein U1E65_09000 [Myxococcota bacterium]
MSGEAFEQRFLRFTELKRDGNSVVGWAEDITGLCLVRRLVKSRRGDIDTRAGLIAEAEYLTRLGCERCPTGETTQLDDGELMLEYGSGPGVELDRLLQALGRGGRLLSPAAAVVLVSEIIHNTETIGRTKPVGIEGRWGHGEIAPRSIVLGRDGFARLYEARLLSSGFRASASPGSAFCRAPELTGGTMIGTPEGDVYAIGAVLALALFGSEAMLDSSEPLSISIQRALEAAGEAVPREVTEVVLRAVAVEPKDRPASATALKNALKAAMPLELETWKLAVLALASFGEELSEDPARVELSPAILGRFKDLLRVTEPIIPRTDGAEDGRISRRPISRRISVVPRRMSSLSAQDTAAEEAPTMPPFVGPSTPPSEPPTDRAPSFLAAVPAPASPPAVAPPPPAQEPPAIQGIPLNAPRPNRDTDPPTVRDTLPPSAVRAHAPTPPAEEEVDVALWVMRAILAVAILVSIMVLAQKF